MVLDWCGSHGTWLDAHEMEDVAAFVMEGGLEQGNGLSADPARTAAIVAAQQLLIEEGTRSREREPSIMARRLWKGFAELFDQILK